MFLTMIRASVVMLCLMHIHLHAGEKGSPSFEKQGFGAPLSNSMPQGIRGNGDLRETLGTPPPPPKTSGKSPKKKSKTPLKEKLRTRRLTQAKYQSAILEEAEKTARSLLERSKGERKELPDQSQGKHPVALPESITQHMDRWIRALNIGPGVPLLDYAKSVNKIVTLLREEYLRSYVRTICPTPRRKRIGDEVNAYLWNIDVLVSPYQSLSDLYSSEHKGFDIDIDTESEEEQRTSGSSSARETTLEDDYALHIQLSAQGSTRKYFFLHTQGTVSKYCQSPKARIQELNNLNSQWWDHRNRAIEVGQQLNKSEQEVLDDFRRHAQKLFLDMLPDQAAEYFIRIMGDTKITDKGLQLDWYLQEAYNFMNCTYGSGMKDQTKEHA